MHKVIFSSLKKKIIHLICSLARKERINLGKRVMRDLLKAKFNLSIKSMIMKV
jgi:hypothetical protein